MGQSCWLVCVQRPLAARTISVAASLDHPTRFSYDPTASYDGEGAAAGCFTRLVVMSANVVVVVVSAHYPNAHSLLDSANPVPR